MTTFHVRVNGTAEFDITSLQLGLRAGATAGQARKVLSASGSSRFFGEDDDRPSVFTCSEGVFLIEVSVTADVVRVPDPVARLQRQGYPVDYE